MSWIIILDGPDGTGKTTLASQLVDDYGAMYIHHGFFKGADWGIRHLASMRRAARVAATGCPVVIDRLWLSGDIYGTVYRGRSDGGPLSRLIHRISLTHGAVTVLCLPARAELANQLHANLRRSEMYSDISKVVRFYQEVRDGVGRRWKQPTCYADVLTGPDPTWRDACVRYDFQKVKPYFSTWLQALVHRAALERASQYLPAVRHPNGYNVAGHLARASHLMVGETLSPRVGLLRYPFGDPSAIGCSAWFTQQLDRALILEEHLLWTNASNQITGENHLRRLLFLKPALRVVALGHVAKQALTELGVTPALVLSNPQHQHRFNPHEPGYLTGLRGDIQLCVLRKME